MYVTELSLHNFRSYEQVEVTLDVGATSFVGRNGQGKTNLVEAIDYLSRLASHRVSSDTPLVKVGTENAIVRAAVVRDGRTATLEVAIRPGAANRAKINGSPLPRTRDMIGLLRTVVFAPDDLTLVKGDPADRRRFLDDLLVLRTPRFAGVKSDFDRVLKQRNALLKSMRSSRSADEYAQSTLEVWDEQLVATGSELIAARLALLDALAPHLATAYRAVAEGTARDGAVGRYVSSIAEELPRERAAIAELMRARLTERRRDELDRALTLVGPHRDELALSIGPTDDVSAHLPVKGYASHGESWSCALALRLASFDLLHSEGDDPILILDDVFAELDSVRRQHLADRVADAEQVLVTAAVDADVPEQLRGVRYSVDGGRVVKVLQ